MPKTSSSELARLKNVPTERTTLFPASTSEKWRPITDRYRLNIKERLRSSSANWSRGTPTSEDRRPVSVFLQRWSLRAGLETAEGDIGGRAETGESLVAALQEASVEFILENGGGAGVRLAKR
jgi:hypothetical protein